MKNLQQAVSNIDLQGSGIYLSGKLGFFVGGDGVTLDSQFYIGSLTKQMTAYLILNALTENYPHEPLETLIKKRLFEIFPASHFLKEIDRPWINEISLLDLLTHRSGLSDYILVYEEKLKKPEALNSPIPATEILQSVSYHPAKPYFYTNTNYFLLGKLLEELTNNSYEQNFIKYIVIPAKMTSSFAPTAGNYHTLKHDNNFANLLPNLNEEIFIDMGNAIGTGNVVSTANDLVRWNEFLQTTNQDIQKIIKTYYCQDEDGEWVNLGFTSSHTATMGMLSGWRGGQDSFNCYLGYFAEQKTSIVIFSNNGKTFESILDVFFNQLNPEIIIESAVKPIKNSR